MSANPQTPLDPMETGCRCKNPSDCCEFVQYTQTESDGRRPCATRLTGSQFARDLVHIQQRIVEEAMGNVGKWSPSDPMETSCHGKNPSDCRESVRERLSKYTAKYS